MQSSQPNIVYILTDDMGYGDVSCLNPDSRIRTAHLDGLAREGMRFHDAHASSAVCTPSRYSILTGRYNWRSRLKRGVVDGYAEPVLEEGRMTVASFLRENGYATACIGKWHLGWDWAPGSEDGLDAVDYSQPIRRGPTHCGFDEFLGFSGSLDMPPYVWVRNDRATAVPDRIVPAGEGMGFWREGPIAPDFDHAQVLPRIQEEAVGYIERRAASNEPFFLYLPLPAPHTPILPLEPYRGKSGTNAYGDFCLQVDDAVGAIMQTLEQNGLAENTLLIFTSDNGCSPMANFEELAGYGHHPSYVFRGHKADIYEGGHRIPLLMRWPRTIAGGSVCDQTVCLSDLLATAADILGVTLPDDAGEDSVSILPLLKGESPDQTLREATVHHSIDGSFSIRCGRWKLEMCAGSGGWSHPRPGPECEGLPPIQLYDLEADIGERDNQQDRHPEVVEKLRALLDRYIAEGRSTPGTPQPNTGGPFWKELWWQNPAAQ